MKDHSVYVEEPDVVELKACPDCGHEALLFGHSGKLAGCPQCQVVTSTEAWNTRASTPPVTVDDVELVERVARAIVSARGGNPDECLHGYSWAAGEMGKAKGGSVCHRRAWQDRIPEARAALEAIRNRKGEDRG
jgi:hypothetical protein